MDRFGADFRAPHHVNPRKRDDRRLRSWLNSACSSSACPSMILMILGARSRSWGDLFQYPSLSLVWSMDGINASQIALSASICLVLNCILVVF